jgi:hypothetical protein
VDTDFLDIEGFGPCPCTQWAAARPGDDPAAVNVTESGPIDDDVALDGLPNAEPVDVGGRSGTVATAEGFGDPNVVTVTVESSGRALALHAGRVPVRDLVTLADSWLDQVDAGHQVDPDELALPEGFTGIAPGTRDGRFEHMVVVRAREQATGAEVEYRMVPTGYERAAIVLADRIEITGGRIRGTWAAPAGGAEGFRATALVDDRLDVVVGDTLFGDPPPALRDEAMDAFVAGLREVPTAEWREAITDADVSDLRVREASSLFEPPLTG